MIALQGGRSHRESTELSRPSPPRSAFRGGIVGRLIVVVEQDAVRGAVEILELAAFERPQESAQADKPEEKGDRDQNDDDVHARILESRKALPVTRSDELDIATAAISGVTSPIIASGTVTAL